MLNNKMKLSFGHFFIFTVFGLSLFIYKSSPADPQFSNPGVKVAFIGDTGDGEGFQAVLDLIKAEDTDLVIHGGDFSYAGLEPWRSMINDTLGDDFPYLGSNGNHDDWSTYWDGFFKDRIQTLVGDDYSVDVNDSRNYSLTYQGIRLVFLGDADADITKTSYPAFVNEQLSEGNANWKICSWHRTGVKNTTTEPPGRSMTSTGEKPNEMSVAVYEACRQNGAMIITAHEHAYLRTLTITKFEDLDPSSGLSGIEIDDELSASELRVGPGSTFVAVSGLGGAPWKGFVGYDFNCDHHNNDWWWATIYTLNHYLRDGIPHQKDCTVTGTGTYGNEYLSDIWKDGNPGGVDRYNWGALFIDFGAGGDPAKATGYFKNIDGQIIDEFTIYRSAESQAKLLESDHYLSSNDQITLSPLADAYVDSDSPEKNFGSSSELHVDEEPSFKISYLKFDLGSLVGENILDAKLRLRVAEEGGAASSTTQNVKLADSSNWGENSINYNNRPLLSTHLGEITSGDASQGVWQEIDVTESIIDYLGQTITFGIDASESSHDGLDLYSRESLSSPQLLVTKRDARLSGPVDIDGDGMISTAEFLAWFQLLFKN